VPGDDDRFRRADSVSESPTESADESPSESAHESANESLGDSARAVEEEAAEVVERDLASLSAERDDYLATLRRVQADFENYRKRMIKEQTTLVERASEGLVEKLLPVLDSFEAALTSVPVDAGEDVAKLRKGIELLYAELLGVLEKSGLARIEADGKPFDPNEHEAVMQEDGDGDPVVAGTLRTGYTYKGKVLRPSMVKVAR
jgi:molecular chaperone GrpE